MLVVDTQGPELRLGDLPAPLELREGDTVTLGSEGIPVTEEVLAALEAGDEVLLNDGRIALRMLDENRGEVVRGGVLSGRKSVKITGKEIPLPVLTERDIRNLSEAKRYGVTGLLQPFVRSGEELAKVRKALVENGAEHVKIFAKIENMQGVANLDDILPHSDVIIIARGDLGNDMDLWQLPAVQKEIAEKCRAREKPFIVVTQMLASMEHNPVPTRAEVSDIFNAILDGAGGVMVTGETAVGEYPVEVIRYLTNTVCSGVEYLAKKRESR
jgi:pyruvate kinase